MLAVKVDDALSNDVRSRMEQAEKEGGGQLRGDHGKEEERNEQLRDCCKPTWPQNQVVSMSI
jgi:hypothetical protein